MKKTKKSKTPKAAPPTEPLWAAHERMKLGDGYSEHDKKRIREITIQLVEGMVRTGELKDPEDRQALKKAVERCARDARQAYNAALEFLCG